MSMVNITGENAWSIVWLTEYRTFGYLIREGAYTSSVLFVHNGEEVQEDIENNEWQYWEEHAIEYESD